ncbi:MAG: LysR family transcriptional regulator [Chloroflexi bacterium]|nr:LysR family transcriptional regulator [Chloroflexota bacterium]
MDLRQLEYFETVSSHRSFRQAARVLGLAQPTLSVQIKQLEHELGVPLIDRSIRPIRLTKAGETLQRRLPRLFEELNSLRDELAGVAEAQAGRVVFGVVNSMAMFVPALLAAFAERYPNITVEVRYETIGKLLRPLRMGEVDVVLSLRQPDNQQIPGPLPHAHLFSFDYVFAVTPGHACAGRREVPPADVAHERFIIDMGPVGQMMRSAFAAAGVTPQIAFESNDARVRVALAAKGAGVALVPEFELHDGLGPMKTFTMAGVPMACEGMLLWANHSLDSHAVNAFIQFATAKYIWES